MFPAWSGLVSHATPAPITASAGRVLGVPLRGGGPTYGLAPSAPGGVRSIGGSGGGQEKVHSRRGLGTLEVPAARGRASRADLMLASRPRAG